MIIRNLVADDVESYRRLRLEAIAESPAAVKRSVQEASEEPVEAIRARITPTMLQIFFGAYAEKELVGMAGMVREPNAKTKHAATIISVYVTPVFRSKGISNQLLQKIIDHAKANAEIVQLTLSVNTANPVAHALYTKLGFVSTGVDHRMLLVDGKFYDEERMILYLDK